MREIIVIRAMKIGLTFCLQTSQGIACSHQINTCQYIDEMVRKTLNFEGGSIVIWGGVPFKTQT